MVSKAYAVICGLFAIIAAVLFLTGNFPAVTAVVFGFVAFGLVFMGMMFVLPYTMTHPVPVAATKRAEREFVPVSRFRRSATQTSQAAQHALPGPLA